MSGEVTHNARRVDSGVARRDDRGMVHAASYPRMELTVGDITQLRVEAIVNAADTTLLGGGGVDGAIHQAAGPRLLAHNRTLGGCPTGEARITPAFDLEARGVKHIIHTVGPIWGTDPRADGSEKLGYRLEDNQLGQCYQACLDLAAAHGVRTLAFPGISTGVYGFPKPRAAQIAVGHVRAFLGRSALPETVVFCCFTEAHAELYRRVLTPKDYSQSIQIGVKPR
jgi:O-acetyl-ADP-ribose deacetylase (regulator of RNase III)